MKKLGFLFVLLATASVFATNPAKELNDVVCLHYDNVNDDPTLSVHFANAGKGDFLEMSISRRRFGDPDGKWDVISETSEQVSVGLEDISVGIDDFVVLISLPIPAWNQAKGPNASFENRKTGKTYTLICENIKK